MSITNILYRSKKDDGLKKDGSLAKKELINYIEMKSGYVLDEGTEPGEIKFNIFDHQPRKRNDSSR